MSKCTISGKTVFVTGAAGFIGSFLCEELLKRFDNVRVIGIDSMNDYYDVSLKEYRLDKLRETGFEASFADTRSITIFKGEKI